MPPRPHIVSFRRLEEPRRPSIGDIRVEIRGALGRPALNLAPVGRGWRGSACLASRRQALIGSIVIVEAIVFLAIVSTSRQGPAGLSHSAWMLAGLSVLFLALSRLRRWATMRVQGN